VSYRFARTIIEIPLSLLEKVSREILEIFLSNVPEFYRYRCKVELLPVILALSELTACYKDEIALLSITIRFNYNMNDIGAGKGSSYPSVRLGTLSILNSPPSSAMLSNTSTVPIALLYPKLRI
jgi:hypothetical protein